MIFVTVGTDHHQFTRLLKAVDHLVRDRLIKPDEVLVQYGLNHYSFRYVENRVAFLTLREMLTWIEKSDITITHASTTAMQVIGKGKVPIVIPRNPQYREVIDNHQLEFSDRLGKELPMIVLRDVEKLGDAVSHYRAYADSIIRNRLFSGSRQHEAVAELDRLTQKWFC